ncbi:MULTISPECIES: tetratricopeptide repeat protein [Cobetia]|uniref:tetratricopeptide repeat protein n=1 Tax=Cobetia TaxID=204286 RepID=UPI0009876F05|nr:MULTISPECIES: tetratricopeptide repeat protein [Cobetia]POR04180.1 hypothetical protein BOH68_17885 [Cobetia sp. MM1IDA2H-1]
MNNFFFALAFIILPSICQAKVYFNDPDDKQLNHAYAKLEKKDVEERNGGPELYFILGVLYSNGNEKFDIEKDPERALELYHKAWDLKVWDAGSALAKAYYNGSGTNIDYQKSKYYLEESAKKGFLMSQRLLGKACWGKKMHKLYDEDMGCATEWLQKAALQGDEEAAMNLSGIYKNGEGVLEDPEKSFFWIIQALESMYSSNKGVVFYFTAEYYEKGYGVAKNLVKAYTYYDLSGTAGSKGKSRVSKNMTDAEIREAIKQSRAWQEEHNTFVPSYYGLQHQSDGSYR